jgi:hypothetical protein
METAWENPALEMFTVEEHTQFGLHDIVYDGLNFS